MKEKVMFMDGVYRKKDGGGIVLVGSRCKDCGEYTFPASGICHKCFGKSMEETELGASGELHTYTVTRMPVQKFPCPHPIGLINLPERVRVFAPLAMQDKYTIGARMEIYEDVLWEEDDKVVMGYKYREAGEKK